MVSPLVPTGFGLVAKTEMPGTGGTVVRAYYQNESDRLMVTIQYISMELEPRWAILGPFDRRHMTPLLQTLRDVYDMQALGFIGE